MKTTTTKNAKRQPKPIDRDALPLPGADASRAE
jgi:hypothetical protein